MTPVELLLAGAVQYLSLVEHHDAVWGKDGVEAVSDGQGGAVLERTPDGLLDQSVRLCIHGCRSLVKDQNLRDQNRPIRQQNPEGRGVKGFHVCLSDQSVCLSVCLSLTLHCLSRALATHSSCLSPTEKFSPFSTTSDSNFRGSWDTWQTDRKSISRWTGVSLLHILMSGKNCHSWFLFIVFGTFMSENSSCSVSNTFTENTSKSLPRAENVFYNFWQRFNKQLLNKLKKADEVEVNVSPVENNRKFRWELL